ncbi:hypothetical protein BDP81DRAFT_443371 [Colletotrichum phormii]|uniref:Uncharacterized protein n=1 Tax=Colletotrichum phormii TaxID=359342 RepID=A0AAJ0E8E8_9PEZI|nr:uncharacterized protein BDP81DRAFT_443371 [Colletotrichum phormii]KAK1621600.1 hypothetical protein BDP81DRAFT_443371 [Colletotrichum phormii]
MAARSDRDRRIHDRIPMATERHVQPDRMSTVVYLVLFSLAVIGLVMAKLAADTFLPQIDLRLSFPSLGSILGGNPKASVAQSSPPSGSWFKTATETAAIVIKTIIATLGGKYMITNGSQCLVDFFPAGSVPRSLLENNTLRQTLTLLSYFTLPTATSATVSSVVPGGFCDPKANIPRFWPPRTRDDIKAILDGWAGLAGLHLKTGGSMTQMSKWKWTFGRAFMWLLGIGTWTTVEIYFGPCWYYPLAWRFWFTIMSASLVSWVLGNAKRLLVREWASVGLVHLELMAYLAVFHLARQADLDGFCSKADCW